MCDKEKEVTIKGNAEAELDVLLDRLVDGISFLREEKEQLRKYQLDEDSDLIIKNHKALISARQDKIKGMIELLNKMIQERW